MARGGWWEGMIMGGSDGGCDGESVDGVMVGGCDAMMLGKV